MEHGFLDILTLKEQCYNKKLILASIIITANPKISEAYLPLAP